VQLQQAEAAGAVLLPQQAVARTPQGDSVKVVAADGALGTRPVKVGGTQGGQWLVLAGLQAGEQVVVDGFQKLQGKTVVKPVPWKPGPVAPGAGASAPAGTGASAPGGPAASAAPLAAPASPAASR